MFFVDGENLSMRYRDMLGENKRPCSHVSFEPNVFVWSRILNMTQYRNMDILRKYYYTSVIGDIDKRHQMHNRLKSLEIEVPKVFRRERGRHSKRVDITLAVDVLTHAHRKNYDIAVLVAGDEDYVPLVEATMTEGCRVFLWFFNEKNGLSEALKRTVDHYFDIGNILFREHTSGIYTP